MRMLHTSDWHLGRRLHGADLGGVQEMFLDHLVATVRAERIDVVLHSGDVFDRSQPPAQCLTLLSETLLRLRDSGATTIMISGNHDAPARLGDKAALLDPRVRLRTDPAQLAEPVTLHDDAGPVRFYPVPYLEPAGTGRDHAGLLAAALERVRAEQRRQGGRSVVLAHAWVVGGAASDSERDISVGGLALAPAALFDGINYVALGHLHRPQCLQDRLRYAGSPLGYSFSEAGQDKSSWLVELDPAGGLRVEAVPVPVGRPLASVRGRLEDLLSEAAYEPLVGSYLSAALTDPVRPVEAMTRLQRRFPFALTLEWCPPEQGGDARSYRQRTSGRSDLAVATSFVEHVRSPAEADEVALLGAALDAARSRALAS